ncbi:MAG: hypothetical protein EOP80_01520 [Variovorax sp.]|nr:MAG: hypothetical protein EOP80_01520 [Variovorax sp.]
MDEVHARGRKVKSSLRNISVTVIELPRGKFGWQLLEKQENHGWQALAEGQTAFARYADAMAAGLLQLQSLVADLSAGPRRPAATSAERQESAATGDDETATGEDAQQPSGKLFGFGPLR